MRGHGENRRQFGEYAQDHKPVREQTEVTGHAVRATYLYCGMADVAARTGDYDLLKALNMPFREIKVEAVKGAKVDTTIAVAGIPEKPQATK